MKTATRLCAALLVLLVTIAPGHAGSCQASIDRVQAQADAIIENRAAQGHWRPESLAATRNYQPTPRSLAAAEGAGNGSHIDRALNALDRARAAERSGNAARCNTEVNKAMRALAVHSSNLQSD